MIPFQIAPPGPVPDFRFLSSAFSFSISLLSLCFFLSSSSRFHLTVVFPVQPFYFRFLAFPLPLRPVSRALLLILCTRLSARFLSSFPALLPQLLHWCLPFAFAFGLGSFPFAHFRSRPVPFRLLSLCPFFSLHPVFPWQRFLRCLFIPVPHRLLPCFAFRFGTQLSVLPFSCPRSASQWLLRLHQPSLRFRLISHSKNLRFWLLGLGDTP